MRGQVEKVQLKEVNENTTMNQQAFVLRITPSTIDRVPEALAENQIIIGWWKANGLLDANLSWEQFREIIRDAYYSGEDSLRKAGSAAGHRE